MKICVIGAGISGLSFARYAKRFGAEVVVYEKEKSYGGIAKVRDVDGIPYHMIGGHCFNSKHKEVLDFVFSEILSEDKWNKVQRQASIFFKNQNVSYPIEFSIKEIYQKDPELGRNIVKDFLSARGKESKNLKDWFINNFGATLANEYFIPYNEKIWNSDLEKMSPSWVEGKLPMPNKDAFLDGILGSAKDDMPHASFYYPKAGTQNFFIDKLADGIDIKLETEVNNIILNDGKVCVDGDVFDHVVCTAPMNHLDSLIDIGDSNVINAVKGLKYNPVTTMLWKRKPTSDTWTYFPAAKVKFHRLIHISNFIETDGEYCIAEAVGKVTYDEMVAAGKSVDILLEPIDYNVSEHAYVLFDKDVEEKKALIENYFEKTNLHLHGRFGNWEYYNMDICILNSIRLAEKMFGSD